MAAALLVGAGLAFFLHDRYGQRNEESFMQMMITPVTSTGEVHSAVVSPDGKWTAYASDEKGEHGIFVRQLATGSEALVVHGTDEEVNGITFSPDGNYLYYNLQTPGTGLSTLYVVPSLGGSPRKLIVDVDSPVSFSPDGKSFVFVRNAPKTSSLIIAGADGSGERPLVVLSAPAAFNHLGVAWSPDGKRIAAMRNSNGDFQTYELETVDAGTGAETRLGKREWGSPYRMAWLPDGSALVFPASVDKSSFNAQMWEVGYPDGEARRITNDLNYYQGATITSDGTALASVQVSFSANIWSAGFGTSAPISAPRQITSGVARADGLAGLTWPTQDMVIYTYYTSGVMKLAAAGPDGSNVHDFALGSDVPLFPSACGDGKHFVLSLNRAGQGISVWRADLDGSNLKQLAGGPVDMWPACSPDGRTVYYTDVAAQRVHLMKVSIDGGTLESVSNEDLRFPVVSPDNNSLAAIYTPDVTKPAKIAVVNAASGEILAAYDEPSGLSIGNNGGSTLAWTRDGRTVLFVVTQNNVSSLWAQPVGAPGAPQPSPKQIMIFGPGLIWGYAISPDGKQILSSRGEPVTDAVLLTHFQ